MADGQATQGSQIAKPNVLKVRRIGKNVITGFAGEVAPISRKMCTCSLPGLKVANPDPVGCRGRAGSTGDAFTLFEELEVSQTQPMWSLHYQNLVFVA